MAEFDGFILFVTQSIANHLNPKAWAAKFFIDQIWDPIDKLTKEFCDQHSLFATKKEHYERKYIVKPLKVEI